MIKRTIAAMGLAALFALPAGAAFAFADNGAEDETTATYVADQIQTQDQDRDRLRIQDPNECGTCPRIGDEATPAPTTERTQEREQLRIQDPSECDGTGAQLQNQLRAQAETQTQFGDGNGGGYGEGPQEGAGPLHEGPADGSGNQFGRQGH